MPLDRPRLKEALALARWAPSAHNTQPWRVALDGDALTVDADLSRWLNATDPTKRDLELSVGAFVRALEISLTEHGFAFARQTVDGGAVRFALKDGAAGDPRTTLLRQRMTSRLKYSERAPPPEILARLTDVAAGAGLTLHAFPTDGADRARVDTLTKASMREGWLSQPARAELRKWMHFDLEGVLRRKDGLSSGTLGISLIEELALKPLMNDGLWRVLAAPYLAPFVADQLAEAEAVVARTAPWIFVLSSKHATRAAGEGLLDFWLQLTQERLHLHPVSVLLDRRGWELSRLLKLSPDRLMAAFRVGYSPPPPRSSRRDVEEFARV
jgi:hypothetical protein